MKRSIKTIICTVALSTLFAFNLSAKEKGSEKVTGFGTSIFASKENKIQVNVDKYNESTTTIFLQDGRGNVVYRESMGKNQTKFRRLLDVSQLPTGNYQILVVSKGEKISKTFELIEKLSTRVIMVE